MNWIDQLPKLDLSQRKYSQYGEDLIAKFIFEQIGATNRFLVDIGAGGGYSNSKEFIDSGWGALRFDKEDGAGIKEFITPHNICALLKEYNCPKEFDFLSVDIDSFDYDVIDNVLKLYQPRVVCAEFNGTLDPNSCVKLKYEEGYTWDGTNRYGFSFGAGIKLFGKHGYTVIFNCKDTNIFAVKSDILPDGYQPKVKATRNIYHPVNKSAVFINV